MPLDKRLSVFFEQLTSPEDCADLQIENCGLKGCGGVTVNGGVQEMWKSCTEGRELVGKVGMGW